MSVYKYIAELNSNQANDLCNQQGLPDASDSDELAGNLVAIVAQNGELALKKIMELHPDKDLILEMFRCSSCESKQQTQQIDAGITEVQPLAVRQLQSEDSYVNASGSGIAKNTNTIILVSALVIALAIISIK